MQCWWDEQIMARIAVGSDVVGVGMGVVSASLHHVHTVGARHDKVKPLFDCHQPTAGFGD